MNGICNIFNPIDKLNGNFLLFSQYVEDLSRSVNDSTIKVRPSRFICLTIDGAVVENAKTLTMVGQESPFGDDPTKYISGYFQNVFENGVTAIKNKKEDLSSNEFTLYFINCLRSLYSTGESTDNLLSKISYIGDIDSTSWEDGFADIIISIGSGSTPILASYKSSLPSFTPISYDNEHGDNNKYYIHGWKNQEDTIPLSPLTNSDITVPETWSGVTAGVSPFDEFMDITADTENNSFTFNSIVVLYDILDSDNNVTTKDVPMGMYFTGDCDLNGVNGQVIIYKSSESAYGAGSGWSLRICTRFSSVPYGNLQVEEISLEPGIIPESISRVLGAAAETIQTVREFADKSIYNSQGLRDLYNLVKNGKMNVPYVREVNTVVDGEVTKVKYWFVNGRNTEVPVYQN